MGDERRQKNPAPGVVTTAAGDHESSPQETQISIQSDLDIIKARQVGRELATLAGFSPADQTLIATAISELARNIVLYAKKGDITLQLVKQSEKCGISITARDEGPGIPDISRALQAGYSTSRSLGLGLPGVKRLMDEFNIFSEVHRGTKVTAKKWKP